MNAKLRQSNFELFKFYARPYYSTYLKKHKSSEWVWVKGRLTDELIMNALDDKQQVSYLNSSYTQMLMLDIDDHESVHAFKNGKPSPLLHDTAVKANFAMRNTPSFIGVSNRGYHYGYLISETLPSLSVIAAAKKMVGHLRNVEVRPTMKSGISIIPFDRYVDPVTLEPIELDLSTCRVYQCYELFGEYYNVTKEEYKKSHKASYLSIHNAETEVLKTLCNGHTNSELMYLSGVYNNANLSIDEAMSRFTTLLKQCNYSGDLLRDKVLRGRLTSLQSSHIHMEPKSQFDITPHQPLVDEIFIIGATLFSRTQCKAILALIQGILAYREKQLSIYREHGLRAQYNDEYRMFSYNVAHGFIPIPSKMLVDIRMKYYKYIAFLKAVGFLVQSDMNYSTGHHYCKSYYIELDKDFINKEMDSVESVDMVQYYNDIIKPRMGAQK